jgi:rfaE bifunctional protein kinase chain/domain
MKSNTHINTNNNNLHRMPNISHGSQVPHELSKLLHNLNKPNPPHILVVGDVMLDRYWFGDVTRISPEAPVPVAKINKVDDRLGGAANVAKNIADLGGEVTLLSVVGNDEAAHTIENLLKQQKINAILHRDDSIQTVMKLRVLARNQQLIRLDFETQPSHEVLQDILEVYTQSIAQYDLIILSDYGKGGLSHVKSMIEIAKKHGKRILVDPKGNNYSKYDGATLITPNKSELFEAVGGWQNEVDLNHKAALLREQLKLEFILLTRSEEGMTLYTADKIQNYPTIAQEVYDVSGAGDTVIATLGLMMANNIDITQAVLLANIAAGIVVGKVGTATTTIQELLEQVETLYTTI